MLDIKKTKEKGGRSYWICKCDCGKIKSIKGTSLTSHLTKSCGCLNKETIIKYNKQNKTKNNKIIYYETLNCLKVYFNNCDEYFLCDVEDRDIAEKYCWYKDGGGYVKGNKRGSGISVLFHRLVLEKYHTDISDYDVDHINHNTLDNRKCNLRKATRSQNQRNSRDRGTNTGERFITYTQSNNLFIVAFYNEPNKYFNNFKDALEYRDIYLNTHLDEFRYNPDKDYENHNIIHPFYNTSNNQDIINPFIIVNKKIYYD